MKQIILLTALWVIAHAALAAEKTVSLPVTAEHERIYVALWEGDISVVPSSADAVTVVADCVPQEPEPPAIEGGLRSLRSSAVLPDIVSSDEVIAIRTYESRQQCTLMLTVPERLDLHTRIDQSGSIRVNAWRGRVLAWSANGDVSVENHSGSLSVTAMNGNATVSLTAAGIGADSAITAANGQLTLIVDPRTVPALRAQARWGDVQTNLELDFDEVVEGGSSWFVTRLNGGQPVLTLRNLNRDIVIRTASP